MFNFFSQVFSDFSDFKTDIQQITDHRFWPPLNTEFRSISKREKLNLSLLSIG